MAPAWSSGIEDAVWDVFVFSPLQLPKTSENSVPVSGCFMLFPWFGGCTVGVIFHQLGFATQAWMLKDGDCARSPQDQLMFGCTAEFSTGLGMFLQQLFSPRKEPGHIWKFGLCLWFAWQIKSNIMEDH